MASIIQQWEADPLFSAAEVVQDSADRLESIFRLLLHEQSLAKGYNPESRLLHSIEFQRRDLATTLETAKWQLEDFEREVNFLATADKSLARQNIVYRHRQFIQAIREQITNVEQSLEKSSVGDSMRISEWVTLNEQDRDGLASFLSGGKHQDSGGDGSVFRKFLDPASSSSISEEIVEEKIVNINELTHLDPNLHLRDNEIRAVGSEMDFEAPSIRENVSGRFDDERWDLEDNEAKGKAFNPNNLTGYCRKLNVFTSLRNFISTCRSGANRNLTKRWKDGEEKRCSLSYVDFCHTTQRYLARLRLGCRCRNFQFSQPELLTGIIHSYGLPRYWLERYQTYSYSIRGRCHPVVPILAILLTLTVLGMLASQIL